MTAWSTLTQVLPTFGLAQIGDDVMGHPRNYIIKDVRTIDDDVILTRLLLSHHEWWTFAFEISVALRED
jgi:hypothetical protein